MKNNTTSVKIFTTLLATGATAMALSLAACGSSSRPTDSLPDGGKSADASQIKVLSNRADLISGGDALVEVVLPTGVNAAAVKMDMDGRDVTSAFALRPNGRYMGLLTGLAEKPNVLSARMPNGGGARITITNYPNGGPIFAGPQIQPWPCLEGATDTQCNRPVSYEYFYKSSTPALPCAQAGVPPSCGNFKPYDPQSPPTDVAMTTTDQGKTVPYIVRVENGTQDRGQYLMAVLFDPAQDWQPWAPQPGWNGKIYNVGGSGCGSHHGESEAPPEVMNDDVLSRGFMVWSTALSHNTLNCNLVVQAESMMMAKERIVEAYGPIRYSIGSGCSGGSIKQQQAANAYPGIFDGILPGCSFPDTWSTMQEVSDCGLLLSYWLSPQRWAPGVVWTETQQAATAGHPTVSICASWVATFLNVMNPGRAASNETLAQFTLESIAAGDPRPATDPRSCNIPDDQIYDAETNPEGVRCGFSDYMPSILGLRPPERWGAVEKALGRGFANRPLDNVGVQYGLDALRDGLISIPQFIDLNAHIGSYDIDLVRQPGRLEADPDALTVAYRGGLINQGSNTTLPIIDIRQWDPAEIHHDYRSYVMRARLDRAHGHHDNQAIWTGATSDAGYAPALQSHALTVMDQWLAAIEADQSDLPYAQKVVKHKPAEARDRCTGPNNIEVPDQSLCPLLYPYYVSPRIIAGQPFTDDVVKCQLKPLLTSDFSPLSFTEPQWAQLKEIFPQGVCDYSKPGVEQQATLPWQTYSGGPGGMPLPAPPVSRPLR